MLSVINVHVGPLPPPEYVYDCYYHIPKDPLTTLYFVTDHPEEAVGRLAELALPVTVVDARTLPTVPVPEYEGLRAYRDSFWNSTTGRFYYIEAAMRALNLPSAFHIENDILVIRSFKEIYDDIITPSTDPNAVFMVRDAPDRVVASLLYFPTAQAARTLCEYVTATHRERGAINDMTCLAGYPSLVPLPYDPYGPSPWLVDGAFFGQYFEGVDPRNLSGWEGASPAVQRLLAYCNPSRGFINETTVFEGPKGDRAFLDGQRGRLVCLHLHCKQFYGPAGGMRFGEIVTGDRIVEGCDAVVITAETVAFHRGVRPKRTILYDGDWEGDLDGVQRMALYTHHLADRENYEILVRALRKAPKGSITLYFHNTDHPFVYPELCDIPSVREIHAQNVDISPLPAKVRVLPIGIANAMWPHGDIITFYSVLSTRYKYPKKRGIFVGLTAGTYPPRRAIMEAVKDLPGVAVYGAMPYEKYLITLSGYSHALCPRGNGLDTHRFWEAVYLGVTPIVVDNESTQCTAFLEALRRDFPALHFVTVRDPKEVAGVIQ